MSKPILTPTGVQQVLDTLYALPDAALQAEADALAADFTAWLRRHFALTPEQETYIDTQFSEAFVEYVSLRVPFALRHRLPITYTVPDRGKATRNDKEGKIIKGKDKTGQGTGGGGSRSIVGPSGSFEFEAVYVE